MKIQVVVFEVVTPSSDV